MAVVKADAYGHGAVRVAQHIEPMVDALAVAFTEEAVALREAGVSAPLLILEGPHTASDLALAGKLNLWPVIHSDTQLEWCKTLGAELSQAWIKLDTGMHRLGFAVERYADIHDTLLSYGIGEVTAMSHLASAEEPDDALTRAQLRTWDETVLRPEQHQSSQLSGHAACIVGAQRLGARGLRAVWGTNQRTAERCAASPCHETLQLDYRSARRTHRRVRGLWRSLDCPARQRDSHIARRIR
jgi:alanine racemase